MKLEWKTCLRLGVTAFLFYLAVYYWEMISGFGRMLLGASGTLILGGIIAYAVNILMSFYERFYFPKDKRKLVNKSRRPVCMVAAMITLLGAIVMIIRLVIPELMACVRVLVSEVPTAIEDLIKWAQETKLLESIMTEEVNLSLEAIDWEQKIEQMIRVFIDGVGGAAQMAVSAVSAFVSVAAELVIGTIFAIYLLIGKERLLGQLKKVMNRYLKPSWNSNIRYVLKTVNGCFHKFIVGQCMEAVILGLLCIIGMTILRFPYAMMVGTLIGFTALIPVAGAYIGAGVGAFMILTVSPVKALAFLVFIVILQQLEGNLIYPKVVGSSIGLPGVWVLAAVTIGGGLMGISGMLIGVPITAALYQLLRNDVNGTVPEEVKKGQKSHV